MKKKQPVKTFNRLSHKSQHVTCQRAIIRGTQRAIAPDKNNGIMHGFLAITIIITSSPPKSFGKSASPPSWQRMHSSAACAICSMPTANQSNHYATSKPHRHTTHHPNDIISIHTLNYCDYFYRPTINWSEVVYGHFDPHFSPTTPIWVFPLPLASSQQAENDVMASPV